MNFCYETLEIFELVGNILTIIKYIIPLTIIVYATFDFVKAITNKESKEINKATKRALFRVIAGILIFLLPGIINYLFSLIGVGESDCLKCVLDTKTCSSVKNNSDLSISGNSSNGECTVENENCFSNAIYNEG